MNAEDFKREARKRDNPWIRLVIGLAILGFGLIAWLDHLGRIDGDEFLRWWALILIALGVAHLINKQWIGAIIWFVFGLAFMPPLPFLPSFHLSQLLGLWPLLISAGGVTLIYQALNPGAKDLGSQGSFRAFAWMGGSGRKVSAANFVGGDAIVVMGAAEINLVDAKIVSEAVIDVLAFWGGIEIHVPHGWRIENHVLAILGGVVDKTDGNAPAGAPTLILRGSAIMGGVEIRYPKGQ